MIDLHCHILPGVDDGALDIRDSAGLARQAAADEVAETAVEGLSEEELARAPHRIVEGATLQPPFDPSL
jgi:tyrosine-protein phosphatase YwqE